jgi:hypothetical protein
MIHDSILRSIVIALLNHGELTRADLYSKCNCGPQQTNEHLEALLLNGTVAKTYTEGVASFVLVRPREARLAHRIHWKAVSVQPAH